MIQFRFVFIFLFLANFVASSGQYVDNNIITQFETNEEVTYLVQLKSKPDLSHVSQIKGKSNKGTFVYNRLKDHTQESQSKIVNYLIENDVDFSTYTIINAIKITSTKDVFNQLVKRNDIDRIIWDVPTKMSDYIEERPINSIRDPEPEWGILKINANNVWEMGYTGQGVVVGGQDTGYDWFVSPLQTKYRGYISDSLGDHNYNWHDAIRTPSPLHADSLNPCGFDLKIPCDDNNHGTHTMGTMVGSDSLNAIGVAPDSKWIACRNMDRGYGSPSTYLECFEWFLAPTDLNGEFPNPSLSPHVINNSWSCPEEEGCNPSNWSILEDAVNNLRAAGIVVVVSAGNSGSNCETISNPAAIFEGSFTVGATRISDTIAGFSSRGLVSADSSYRIKPNVSAPGQNVRSVVRGGNYRNLSGTSMAGPHVAGVVSLIISANPSLAGEVELIEDIIEQSSVPLLTEQECNGLNAEEIPNPTYGFGRIDALRAVQLAQQEVIEFAPIGAEWTFEYKTIVGDLFTYKINSVGEQNILGKNCKVLVKKQATCDLLLDTIYIHQDYNKIFHYAPEKDSFYLMYDFNKIEGQMYRTDYFNWLDFVGPGDTSYVYNIVDSVKMIEVDGISFQAQYVYSEINGNNVVIPQIGSLTRMFQVEYDLCDGDVTTALRCYRDDNIDIKITPDENCDIINTTHNVEEKAITIYPNPSEDIIVVKGLPQQSTFSIINTDGRFIFNGTLAADRRIDVSNLQTGVYILRFEELKRNLKFVKI